ncbi:hypothetical protein KDK82_2294 [Delftia sp. K82]|uniref:hypothetical protein n=1 Tax=Delftia sp. K82 TaxID=1472718 RepID=UPI000B734EF3|nr:hypothetical protein [Delftia sp. K82]OWG18814.1 hypothetical protein KDK82_2294 [Delftia sp. K82]
MANLNSYLSDILSPAAALIAAVVAYVAVYRNSQPQIVVYYEPSSRQQSIINLVIENVGTGSAFDISFSSPIPVGFFGIEASNGSGKYIPASGIPSLAPGQRLVFCGGQYAGLLKELGEKGLRLDISYHFNPPLWRKKNATDTCVISVWHLQGMPTLKSMEEAVVNAIDGRNASTVVDIRSALQGIENHLAKMTGSTDEGSERDSE